MINISCFPHINFNIKKGKIVFSTSENTVRNYVNDLEIEIFLLLAVLQRVCHKDSYGLLYCS